MKIYVASSWRNERQQDVVKRLRDAGHVVYDYKHPNDADDGFHWHDVDIGARDATGQTKNWREWTPEEFRRALNHPVARRGFVNDMTALEECDACVLVLPCGKSAHLELGWAAGKGKLAFVLSEASHEPELMYLMCTPPVILLSLEEIVEALKNNDPKNVPDWRLAQRGDWERGKGGEFDRPKTSLPGETSDWAESKRRQNEG